MDTTNLVQRVLYDESSVAVRTRGREYQRQGRVSLLHCAADSAEAKVKGTDRYGVRIWLRGDRIGYQCTCPFSEAGELCKHVWAVTLELDQNEVARPFRIALAGGLAASSGFAVDTDNQTPERLRERFTMQTQAFGSSLGHEHGRWQRLLGAPAPPHAALIDPSAQDWYLIDPLASGYGLREPKLILLTARRNQLKRGGLGRPTGVRRPPSGARPDGLEGTVWDLAKASHDGTAALGHELARQILPELARLGRLGALVDVRGVEVTPLTWAGGPRWKVVLDVASSEQDREIPVQGTLERQTDTGVETCSLARVRPLPVDLLLVGEKLYELERGHDGWLRELLSAPLTIDRAGLKQIARELSARANAPRFRDLALTGWVPERGVPKPRLRLLLPGSKSRVVQGSLTFVYGDQELGWTARDIIVGDRLVERDLEREAAHLAEVTALGMVVVRGPADELSPFSVSFDADLLPEVTSALLDRKFIVEIEGKPYRRRGTWQPIVQSDQDWFDLEGNIDFEGERLTMPELLRAVRERQHWVKLKDGSIGLLPEAWIDSLAALADWVPPRANKLRFHMSQASWIESVLRGTAELDTDAGFREMKARLAAFQRIEPLKKPSGFQGDLREYQELALGWLSALDELGFGGCLADDMGLGKTIVVLAWLLHQKQRHEERRGKGTNAADEAPAKPRPSLVVVPKSLLWNWRREAERFTPTLRVLTHHGNDRLPPGTHFHDYDLVLTSYGTLRRDVEALATLEFDTIVLDEAHSIKNAWTSSHQAARSLTCRQRLGLTGTPVENHLGELWNLMSFLNPLVFAGLGHMKKAFENRRPSQTALESVVLKSVQPFILRRTKAQVAKELPERIEKTLQVSLSKEERKLYDDLADFFRRRILERRTINRRTEGKSGDNGRQTAEALEALLRLRQAACHPGLLDDSRKDQSSSKLDLLLEQLQQVRAGGHKALVFSQFTKLLGLLIPRLDEAGIGYAYLDGKTNDREAEVERFQTDPNLSAFLISLKAGGVGLNLVAAEYVFLLDPWWNPASEAQAIDRAHRIGQTRTVIAYRLLASDTVEEKVAALQNEKRELAAALFGDEQNFSAKFTREDLEALLG